MRAPFVRMLALPLLTLLAASGESQVVGPAAAPVPKPAASKAGAAAPAAPAAPKDFEYAASTGQYRLTASSKISQSMMGQSQDMETSSMRLVSITVARTAADTLSLSMVLDSVSVVGPMGMSPPGMDKLAGAKFAAKVSPSGAVYSASGPSEAESPQAATMTDEMGRMLPRIKSTLAQGATWTDTVADKPKQNGISQDRQIISHFTVVGDSTVGGETAWKITRESTTSATGTGAPQGQNVVFESTGTGKGVILISKRGVLLGGESEEISNVKVTVTGDSTEIGIKSTTTTKVLKVK
jgi:hypothetical protein